MKPFFTHPAGTLPDLKCFLTAAILWARMIDRQLASFLQEGLGIHVGTRNERLQPEGARALAARVHDDGRHIDVYIARVAAKRVRPNLQANGHVAVVFGRPIDDRACQLKGIFVGARPARGNERPFVDAQWNAFLANLERIGIPRSTAASWVTWPADVIRIRTTAVFEQTPGPQAGTQLK